jgi:hypothetical protein
MSDLIPRCVSDLIPRTDNAPVRYSGPAESGCYVEANLRKSAPQTRMHISSGLLWVRYNERKATAMCSEEIALAALALAAHCPKLRADLVARLTAQDAPAEVSA